jgi:outer membrane protein assembly factor BamA
MDLNHIIKSKVYTFIDEYNQKYEQISHIRSSTNLIPALKYTWDNALWSYTHPVEGSRYYLKYRNSLDVNESIINFHSVTVDGRKYFHLFNGVSFAGRIFAGKTLGLRVQKFRLGGIPCIFSNNDCRVDDFSDENEELEEVYFSEYVMPIRGIQRSNRLGANIFLANFEFRLPFLIYYFPTIKYLGQINGVVFTDLGVAWDNKYPKFWDGSSWEEPGSDNPDYTGWVMSYGFGPRFIFLGFPWQLDFAWQYNPHKGTISQRKWYLSIGLDF